MFSNDIASKIQKFKFRMNSKKTKILIFKLEIRLNSFASWITVLQKLNAWRKLKK